MPNIRRTCGSTERAGPHSAHRPAEERAFLKRNRWPPPEPDAGVDTKCASASTTEADISIQKDTAMSTAKPELVSLSRQGPSASLMAGTHVHKKEESGKNCRPAWVRIPSILADRSFSLSNEGTPPRSLVLTPRSCERISKPVTATLASAIGVGPTQIRSPEAAAPSPPIGAKKIRNAGHLAQDPLHFRGSQDSMNSRVGESSSLTRTGPEKRKIASYPDLFQCHEPSETR